MNATSQPRTRAPLALVALAGSLFGACSETPSPPASVPPAAPARPATPQPSDEIDRLRAIGYVGFGEEDAEPEAPSVRHLDVERRQPGYDLVIHRDFGWAHLIDAEGAVLHTWHDKEARHWSNAELLANGDLLVPGSRRETRENFLLRLSWDGEVRWRADVDAHHDVERVPDGRIATLTYDLRRITEVDPRTDVKDHHITLLDDEGEVLESASLYDMLASGPELFRFQDVGATSEESRRFVDLLHANSLEWMRHEQLAREHALYALDNVIVSFRHQDTIAIFDWSTKTLVWAWGQGILSGQHDATVLPNGNVLVFDNGLAHARSRIVELDPRRNEIVWKYTAPEPGDFFSLRKGSSQRLANGNTLVANSDSGEAFEVTPGGELVWHYVTPRANKEGKRATIVRIKRYPAELVEPLLAR